MREDDQYITMISFVRQYEEEEKNDVLGRNIERNDISDFMCMFINKEKSQGRR